MMKLPFYTVLGPPLKKNYRTFKCICDYAPLHVSTTYVIFLGALGMGLSFFDVIRIIKSGAVLPIELYKTRISSGGCVRPEIERDLKLLGLAFSLEYYMLLIFGAASRNPVLFLPYLILYAFIITTEIFFFFLRVIVEGMDLHKPVLLQSIFMVYNWLAIFCTFLRLCGLCDF